MTLRPPAALRDGPTRDGRPWLVLLLAGALALALAAPAASEPAAPVDHSRLTSRADGPAPSLRAAAGGGATKVQRVVVKWNGSDKKKDYQETAVIPGIGNATLICRPDATMIRLYAVDRDRETQMWMAKYETKDGHAAVAVKTARIYRYDTATDDGTGGTGSYANEGFNQRGHIENYSSGYMHGVISQRPGRQDRAGGAPLQPVTSFTLNWYWNGFDYGPEWRSCKVDAVFKTNLKRRIGLNWHGSADGADHPASHVKVPGAGTLLLRCERPADGGRQFVALEPRRPDSQVYVEIVTGEGRVEDHVETFTLGYDPETKRLGPFALPRNGIVRLFFTVGNKKRRVILSSQYLTNNTKHLSLNLCEIAGAPF